MVTIRIITLVHCPFQQNIDKYKQQITTSSLPTDQFRYISWHSMYKYNHLYTVSQKTVPVMGLSLNRPNSEKLQWRILIIFGTQHQEQT